MSIEENKTIARRFIEEVWNKGNVSFLNEILTSDCVSHFTPSLKAVFRGPEEYKQAVSIFRTAFPDLHFAIEDLIAEGDKVACYWIASGTSKGQYMNYAPTGKQMKQPGVTIFGLANGKIVSHIAIWDEINGLRQTGIMPEA